MKLFVGILLVVFGIIFVLKDGRDLPTLVMGSFFISAGIMCFLVGLLLILGSFAEKQNKKRNVK